MNAQDTDWLFPISYARHEGKYTDPKSFNPVSYFDSYLYNDYLQIDTTGESSDTNVFYGFRTTDAFEVPVNLSDKAFTGSVWVKHLAGATSKAYIEIYLCDENHNKLGTAKLEVSNGQTAGKSDSSDSGTKYENLTDTYYSYATKYVSSSEFDEDRWTRIYVTITGVDKFIADGTDKTNEKPYNVSYVMMDFGVQGPGKFRFANLKLERGKVPTDASLSLAEMWEEFDNANYIRTIPVNPDSVSIDKIKDGQGLLFDGDSTEWVAKYLATGGGGGFVVQSTPPENTEVLWYVHGTDSSIGYTTTKSTDFTIESSGNKTTTIKGGTTLYHYEDAFYYYTKDVTSGAGWYPAEKNYHLGDSAPKNPRMFWLKTSNGKYVKSGVESPDLMYWDPDELNDDNSMGSWKIVGAEARPSWVIQDTPPTGADADLMWITTSGIASVPYTDPSTGKKIWLPIQAIWGNND
jgi:hypothetical protein